MLNLKKLLTKIITSLYTHWDLNKGSNIPDSSDLDTYLDVGNYYVERSGNAQTVAHSPVTTAGYVLKVMEASAGGNYRIQVALPNDNHDIYKRYYNTGSGWTDWQHYRPEQVRNTQFALTTAQTKDVTVEFGLGSSVTAMFLISCTRYTVNTDTNSGLYLVKAYKSGSTAHYNVSAIKSATGVTITCDGETISITTTVTYMAFSVMQVY